ncbi:hypothetical protein OAH98_00710 [Methylophilaceae bacterium]|nr:hypothetical protein [Methylophilaceae bacterium]
MDKLKKLILLLFLIPNLVMAETWVCSYLMNDEIQTSTFKRLSDKEFKSNGSTDRLYYEDDKSITLTHTSGFIGFRSTILDKEHKKFIKISTSRNSRDGLKENFTINHWKGDCEVVE